MAHTDSPTPVPGIFNVDTTSTKDAAAVAAEVERVLCLSRVGHVRASPFVFDCQVRPPSLPAVQPRS
jgi:hypothetical protein